jgi:glycosyltransferase involved in cell wall biosynthesis
MSSRSSKKQVAFSVINCICFDQRVLKIAGTVRELDCDITIIGRKSGDCYKTSSVPFVTVRFYMIFNKGFLFYKFFNIRLFFYLLFHRFDLLVANDLDTLLPNYLISRLKKTPLVFDSHEYFTGLPEIRDRPFVKWVWTTIEKSIFPKLKYVITVSDSIAEAYSEKYGLKPVVVRNCSGRTNNINAFSKSELGINTDHFLLVFQGAGINIERGGEELIDAIKITENVSLIIVGSGEVMSVLKKKVHERDLSGRIKFFPKMPWDELMKYTKSASAGLCLEKDTNLNYRYCLPNKLFEYISAGIPVITGSLPEIKKVVEEYECGIIIPEITPGEISKAISKLRDDPALLNKLKRNTVIASEKLNWNIECKIITDFYNQILKTI